MTRFSFACAKCKARKKGRYNNVVVYCYSHCHGQGKPTLLQHQWMAYHRHTTSFSATFASLVPFCGQIRCLIVSYSINFKHNAKRNACTLTIVQNAIPPACIFSYLRQVWVNFRKLRLCLFCFSSWTESSFFLLFATSYSYSSSFKRKNDI